MSAEPRFRLWWLQDIDGGEDGAIYCKREQAEIAYAALCTGGRVRCAAFFEDAETEPRKTFELVKERTA